MPPDMSSSALATSSARVLPFVRNEATARRELAERTAPKCLWISRDIPFPQDAGDRIYSANMSYAFSQAGVRVNFLGYGAAIPSDMPDAWTENSLLAMYALGGEKRGKLNALFSALPIAAAIHATPAYRALLARQLCDTWDVIVIDSYGSGWALDACLAASEQAKQHGRKPPTLVYLSHNPEESIWRAMYSLSQASAPKRLLALLAELSQGARIGAAPSRGESLTWLPPSPKKTHSATHIRAQANRNRDPDACQATQGWSKHRHAADASTPRRVVLVGSSAGWSNRRTCAASWRWPMRASSCTISRSTSSATCRRHCSTN